VRDLVPAVTVRTVPGITAMQDLAARSQTILAEGDERLALVPYTAGDDQLREALSGFDTVVIYKGGRHHARIKEALRDAGRLQDAVYGEQLGLDGEAIEAVAAHDGRGPYMSTVIVPAPRTGTRGAALLGSAQERAR
jgi:precorrin-2/cobalt-factor-2 C20-methyltransferase